jgi:Zn-dependent M28 family amino/carboxypeptidase
MLFAHWDSRPFADRDSKNKGKAILGANDGASGVGVLLEVARQIQKLKPNIGVDIFFFDAEDYGQPSSDMRKRQAGTWCLGSQYWANNPHKANYNANFGILLDMVGASNAYFTKEAISMYYAPQIVDKVWGIASALGHGNHFVFQQTSHVGEDDHLYINKIANIPSIDIIQYDPATTAFAPHWHTHDDNMDVIDKNTLAAVGETVLATVLREAK